MGKTFILAEKPSVAKSFAKALNVKKVSAYYEDDSYVITNCIGHLYRTYYPEDYDAKYKIWEASLLPIIPSKFKYKVNASVKEQANLVRQLLNKYKYDKIIIATDAGREGELIGSVVLKESGIKDKSNVFRFWCSSALTEDTILKELEKIKPISEFATIEAQGYYRSYADWLLGINITRLVTLGSGTLCHCGRVKTAVLYEIYKREQEIKNFVPKVYFENIATLKDGSNEIKAKMYKIENGKINTSFNFKGIDKNKFLNKIFIVENKDTQTKIVNAEKLFNITALQKKAFKELGLTPDKTLQITQTLYEEYKCLSYPRTPSRVMGNSDVELTKTIFKKFAPLRESYCQQIDESLFSETNKRIFNDKLLEDHHALIPLDEIPNEATDMEKRVFELVVKNFFCTFSKPYRYEAKTIYFDCDGDKFLSRGKKDLELGWKLIDKTEDEKSEGGEEYKNDFSQIDFENLRCIDIASIEKQTKPKSRYRFDSILSFMENPKDEDADKKLVGLGTPATRAKILQDLIDDKYIMEENKNLQVLNHGKFLLKQIKSNKVLEPLIDVQTTTSWEERLTNDPSSFYEDIKSFVKKACTSTKFEKLERKRFGVCPICKGEIYEGKKNYYCSGYKSGCKFSIWKEISSATITEKDLKDLLSGKLTEIKKCKSKQGKHYTCKFKLNNESKIEFVFQNN